MVSVIQFLRSNRYGTLAANSIPEMSEWKIISSTSPESRSTKAMTM
ncbi:hypothetical protein ACKUB1_17065 [Methanospirillum stamsii]|nr:hypothetical protein [Methanospirillum stamsii]